MFIGLRCGNQTPKVFNMISPDTHVGLKSGAEAQPRKGLNTKATELDQDLNVESWPKALICSTPSGVTRIADHLSIGFQVNPLPLSPSLHLSLSPSLFSHFEYNKPIQSLIFRSSASALSPPALKHIIKRKTHRHILRFKTKICIARIKHRKHNPCFQAYL